MKPKPFENPLIPHARMRALYRGLVEARVLGERGGWPKNLEACWVATAIDLGENDLTSDSDAGWLTSHIRALGQRKEARAATISDVRTAKKNSESASVQSSVPDRMFMAIGQAIALKVAAAQGAVIAYTAADGLKKSEWGRLLLASEAQNLPLIIVAIPGRRESQLHNLKIPVIPVDAGDPVAIYRVAQESIVRARTDGGIAVIECVDCGVDPIALLSTQLLKKGICTTRWLAAVETAFRSLLT